MGRTGFLCVCLAALSGCYTQTWYSEGRSFRELEILHDRCRAEGNMRGARAESRLEDSLDDALFELEKDNEDALIEVETALRQEGIRVANDFFFDCMFAMRAFPIEVQRCPDGIAPPPIDARMPPKSQITCAVQASDGWRWRVVAGPQ